MQQRVGERPILRDPGPKPGELVVSKTGVVYRIMPQGYWQREQWDNMTPQEQEGVDLQLRALEKQQKAAAQR